MAGVDSCWTGFDGEVRAGELLGEHTTLRVGGPAEFFVVPAHVEGYADAVRRSRAAGLSLRMLGGGSNLLVSSGGVRGVVLATRGGPLRFMKIEGNLLRAGAACSLQALVRKSCAAGLKGLETVTGIPGCLGGAIAMNAGGQYGTVGPLVRSVAFLDEEGRWTRWDRKQLRFDYRRSNLRGKTVLEAELELEEGEPAPLLDRLREITAQKRASQPTRLPSAGCIFKNCDGAAAGYLIERAGMKGVAEGDAVVSPVHANFIINKGRASSDEVFRLIDRVRGEVERRFRVRLDLEVEVW
jgi:UDP-N-acetylmuramate dehydrogenase